MKCRAFLCLCSLLLPWATSLATSATSEPEYIQTIRSNVSLVV